MDKTSTLTKTININFVVPTGTQNGIYPWGVSLIKDYILKTSPDVSVQIRNLYLSQSIDDLLNSNKSSIKSLFGLLNRTGRDFFRGEYFSKFKYLTGFLGNDLIEIARKNRLIKKKYSKSCPTKISEKIANLHTDFIKLIDQFIDTNSKSNDNGISIWAISVYDQTMFNSIALAQIIKEKYPKSYIIMGGEAFTHQIANSLIEKTSYIDAIGIGYGEELMRQLITELDKGIPVSQLKIKGLITKNSVTDKTNGSYKNTIDPRIKQTLIDEELYMKDLSVPEIYKGGDPTELINCIQSDFSDKNRIRVLPQRGCKWGKCSFCVDRDKKFLFSISFKDVQTQLHSAINEKIAQNDKNSEKILVSIDSEDVDAKFIIDMINFFSNTSFNESKILVSFWFRIQAFSDQVSEALNNFNNDNVQLEFIMNMESLNSKTLQKMCKGHSPLKALEAIKTITDIGKATFSSNYMLLFPLDKYETFADEIDMLKNSMHLLIKGTIVTFPYSANSRDKIFQHQNKYDLKIERHKGDVWIKDKFGVDLEFSHWAFKYTQKFSWNLDHISAWTVTKVVQNPKLSKFFFLMLHIVIAIFFGRKAYIKRSRIIKYIQNFTNLNNYTAAPADSEISSPKKSLGVPPRFYIRKSVLFKEYSTFFNSETWRLRLTSKELNVLRFLYKRRKYDDLFTTFKNEISKEDIENICNRHIMFGTILKKDSTLLCVANDPGYWEINIEQKAD